ncbi:MAG TPA: glycosyltransferase [Mycobacteriales bacterium]|nr:glycosyltransferase [Mycobacteriales bacterium]
MLTQTLSVVVPVYRAGPALRETVRELLEVSEGFRVADSISLVLDEVVLVCDNPALPAAERQAVRDLEALDPRVRTVWLARNYGQHPATVAGIVSTNGDWLVTMDEDGQHDPAQIPAMLRTAAETGRPLVYARPTNPPPHGALRNAASRTAKAVFRGLSGSSGEFHSFRLVEGSLARSACAYMGDNVYLDVAMLWTCGDGAHCPMRMRDEGSASSYRARTLLSHFWRMVLSTGTRPLRLIAAAGVLVALLGVVVAAYVALRRLTGEFPAPGWTSVMVAQLLLAGGLFVSLAVLAEYVGFAVRNAIGKPLYVTADHVDSRVLHVLQRALDEVPAPVPAR